jgi:hypothetical protein
MPRILPERPAGALLLRRGRIPTFAHRILIVRQGEQALSVAAGEKSCQKGCLAAQADCAAPVLAAEIIEDLEAALEQFREVATALRPDAATGSGGQAAAPPPRQVRPKIGQVTGKSDRHRTLIGHLSVTYRSEIGQISGGFATTAASFRIRFAYRQHEQISRPGAGEPVERYQPSSPRACRPGGARRRLPHALVSQPGTSHPPPARPAGALSWRQAHGFPGSHGPLSSCRTAG